jgi:nucleoside-diphosphate-sugar epimerase
MKTNSSNKSFPFHGALITGAAGFLGCHLSKTLLDRNIPVVGVDNFVTGSKENIQWLQRTSNNFQFIEADVCGDWTKKIPATPSKISHILHFASPASPPIYQNIPVETLEVNSIGTKNCLDLAQSMQARMVFASTSEVYGDPQVSPQPESYWGHVNSFGARSCYDEAKRYAEALIYSYNQTKKSSHGLVRIFNTYGPRMNPSDGRVVINLLLQGLQGKPLTIYGNGLQTRSFCYVDDLVQGILTYAETTSSLLFLSSPKLL